MSNIGYLPESGLFLHVFYLKIKRNIKLSLTHNCDFDEPVNLMKKSSLKLNYKHPEVIKRSCLT